MEPSAPALYLLKNALPIAFNVVVYGIRTLNLDTEIQWTMADCWLAALQDICEECEREVQNDPSAAADLEWLGRKMIGLRRDRTALARGELDGIDAGTLELFVSIKKRPGDVTPVQRSTLRRMLVHAALSGDEPECFKLKVERLIFDRLCAHFTLRVQSSPSSQLLLKQTLKRFSDGALSAQQAAAEFQSALRNIIPHPFTRRIRGKDQTTVEGATDLTARRGRILPCSGERFLLCQSEPGVVLLSVWDASRHWAEAGRFVAGGPGHAEIAAAIAYHFEVEGSLVRPPAYESIATKIEQVLAENPTQDIMLTTEEVVEWASDGDQA